MGKGKGKGFSRIAKLVTASARDQQASPQQVTMMLVVVVMVVVVVVVIVVVQEEEKIQVTRLSFSEKMRGQSKKLNFA